MGVRNVNNEWLPIVERLQDYEAKTETTGNDDAQTVYDFARLGRVETDPIPTELVRPRRQPNIQKLYAMELDSLFQLYNGFHPR
jgi:hypothetical protein